MYLSKPTLLCGLTFNCVKSQMKYIPLTAGGPAVAANTIAAMGNKNAAAENSRHVRRKAALAVEVPAAHIADATQVTKKKTAKIIWPSNGTSLIGEAYDNVPSKK